MNGNEVDINQKMLLRVMYTLHHIWGNIRKFLSYFNYSLVVQLVSLVAALLQGQTMVYFRVLKY